MPNTKKIKALETLRAEILNSAISHYENGFKHVHEAYDMADEIIASVEKFLDIEPEFSYNGS